MKTFRFGISRALVLCLLFAGGLVGCSDFDDYERDPGGEYQTLASRRMTKNEIPPWPWSYPSVTLISNDHDVTEQMDAAWNLMIASCSPVGRKEYGFLIYYNFPTGTYSFGEMIEGPLTGYGTNGGHGGSVEIEGLWQNDEGDDLVAYAHVHTSLYYAPDTVSRKTGPSPPDLLKAAAIGLPGLLYDYTVPKVDSSVPLNAPHQMYTFGPSVRTGGP
ncbi:MAG: hypothetical protein K6F98_00940 [Bacteroidales bacterium]|nr:hypothetical protein [Bacteroidales bacterium]